jgi:hypothetical protein
MTFWLATSLCSFIPETVRADFNEQHLLCTLEHVFLDLKVSQNIHMAHNWKAEHRDSDYGYR